MKDLLKLPPPPHGWDSTLVFTLPITIHKKVYFRMAIVNRRNIECHLQSALLSRALPSSTHADYRSMQNEVGTDRVSVCSIT